MVKLLTKPSTELTPVEDDLEVVAARERYDELTAQKRALETEWRTLARTLNPNGRASEDHRGELTITERIRAEERQRELVPLLRLTPAELEPAAEAVAAARRAAYDARYPVARQRVREKLRVFYAALDALVGGPHRALVDEIAAQNALLKSPIRNGLVPPPFDLLALGWAELREGDDGPVAARARFLRAGGWLDE